MIFRLLDSFHDLNKIICQRFTKANSISRELLLKTLQLEQHQTVSTKPSSAPVKFCEEVVLIRSTVYCLLFTSASCLVFPGKSTYYLDSQSQTLPWPPNSPSTHPQCCCQAPPVIRLQPKHRGVDVQNRFCGVSHRRPAQQWAFQEAGFTTSELFLSHYCL